MTIKRAIEILDPEHREHYADIEEVNKACRMGMQALALLRPIPVKERSPESFEYVLGYAYGLWEGHDWLDGEWVVVEYDEYQHLWTMTDDPESHPVQVSHWMELPPEPEGEEEDDG